MRLLTSSGSALVILWLGACSPTALPLGPDHPGRATAATGRLAGPPAALGVDGAADALGSPAAPQPGTPAGGHGGHVHGAAAADGARTP